MIIFLVVQFFFYLELDECKPQFVRIFVVGGETMDEG
jgi:hypothetical protein